MATAAPASLCSALAARCSCVQRGAATLLPPPPRVTRQRVVATPARAGLFDGLFGKPAAKPAKPAKPGMKPISGSCATCKNTGGVACKGCKGTGKNKANGNPFERFKCYDCQARGSMHHALLRCFRRSASPLSNLTQRTAHTRTHLGSPRSRRRGLATFRARRAGGAAAG